MNDIERIDWWDKERLYQSRERGIAYMEKHIMERSVDKIPFPELLPKQPEWPSDSVVALGLALRAPTNVIKHPPPKVNILG